jgi:hypothetical protein
MFEPSAERMARQGAVLAAGVVAFAQIVGSAFAGTESAQDSPSLVMIDPATTVMDAPAAPTKRVGPVTREPGKGGNPLWSLPLSSLSVTRERPIFSPSRRPPPPPAVAAPYVPPVSQSQPPSKPPEPDHPPLTLVGTLAETARELESSSLRLIRPRCVCGPARITRDGCCARSAAEKPSSKRASGRRRSPWRRSALPPRHRLRLGSPGTHGATAMARSSVLRRNVSRSPLRQRRHRRAVHGWTATAS